VENGRLFLPAGNDQKKEGQPIFDRSKIIVDRKGTYMGDRKQPKNYLGAGKTHRQSL
jgi:hypothetical protein